MRARLAALVAVALVAGGVALAWSYRREPSDPDPDQADISEALPLPPLPPRIAEGEEYETCLGMLAADPTGANGFAETWEAAGGGDGARHCHALAQIALGDVESGAALLEKVAGASRAPAAARAALYGQADQAWMIAGLPGRAYDAAAKALALSGDNADLLVDRATAAVALARWNDAVEDLTQALDIDSRRPDALVLRGVAWRQTGRLDLARGDIDRAFTLDPENPEAFLERGILRQRAGDRAGAHEDWVEAMALAPDTSTSDLAEQNLALLEAGPDR